ncbi:MAG: sulfotransferase [Methylococcaceae bacterium]
MVLNSFGQEQTGDVLLSFLEQDWQEEQGLASLILISAGGTLNYDFALAGQMAETPLLQRSPQLKAMLTALQLPLSRCRLIRLPQGEHHLQENSFHRFIRQLIYIPLLHSSGTQFYIDDQAILLPVNVPYRLNGAQAHKIVNPDETVCVYLQIEMLSSSVSEKNFPFLEPHQFEVLSPKQFQHLVGVINDELAESTLDTGKSLLLQQSLHILAGDWENTYNRFGKNWAGELSYQDVLLDFSTLMNGKQAYLHARGQQALAVIETVLRTANRPKAKRHFSRYFFSARHPLPDSAQCPHFEKPIFIISAPRAGSTLLFETLAQFPNLWTIGEESHELIEDIPQLNPAAQDFDSNRLTELHASSEIADLLKRRFVRQLRNREGVAYSKSGTEPSPGSVRFLEKTPKNALRIPFLKAVFPDALFVYLYREPAENISSLLEGWRSLRFIAYRNLPNWVHRQWSFFLPTGWRELHSTSLATIAAYQWHKCNETIVNDLKNIPDSDWCRVSYADLVASPEETLMQIAHFAELDKDNDINALLAKTLPVSRLTLSDPAANKWRKYESELNTVLPELLKEVG